MLSGLGIPNNPWIEFLLMAVSGVVLYFALSSISYLVVFVWMRQRLHPDYVRNRLGDRRAMLIAVVGIVGSVALLMPFNVLMSHGFTAVYWDSREHHGSWMFIAPIVYLLGIETGIYWIHRFMHRDWPYRFVHRFHHAWRNPTSWTSMAFHPVDSFMLALPMHAMMLVVPIHGLTFNLMQVFLAVWSVSVHDRTSVVHWNWFNHTDNHTLHHWFYQCNYGQFTTFWDRAMGTWRDPVLAAEQGEVPASVVRRAVPSAVLRPSYSRV